MKKKILIVEDDSDIASMIEYNLREEGFDTRIVGNGLEALTVAKMFHPDIIILDIMLPGLNGFEVCKKLKSDEKTSSAAIIMLTVKASETDVVLGLELGADDYVTKPFSPRVLIARVKSILRRETEHQKPVTKINYYSLTIDLEKREVWLDDKLILLSRTEFEILALLTSKPGKVFSRNTILERCWPDGVVVIDRSIDVHINSIRKKMGAIASNIESIRGIGYRVKE